MPLQEALRVKFLANDTVINPKTSERLKDIQAPITAQIRKTHGSPSPSAWSAGEEFQRLFHSRGKPLRQFGSKNLV